MKAIKALAVFVLAFAVSGVYVVDAKEQTTGNTYLSELVKVSPIELPAKAAQMVVAADSFSVRTVTIEVVKAAVNLNPAAAQAVVGAIARAKPVMAETAAVTATRLLPIKAAAIAKAAATGAPKWAQFIASGVCREVPSEYKNIAVSVTEAAPDQKSEILAGVYAAIPSYRDPIEKAIASIPSTIQGPLYVETVLTQAKATPTVASVPAPRVAPALPSAAPRTSTSVKAAGADEYQPPIGLLPTP